MNLANNIVVWHDVPVCCGLVQYSSALYYYKYNYSIKTTYADQEC